MWQLGFGESVEDDAARFTETVKPLRGDAPTNSRFSEPPELCFLSPEDKYSLLRTAFNASLRKLRSDIVDFVHLQEVL